MKTIQSKLIRLLLASALLLGSGPALAAPFVQCPAAKPPLGGDPQNQTAEVDPTYHGPVPVACMHLAAGDGFVTMADGTPMYMFGFADVTKVPVKNVISAGAWAASSPAPTISVTEGDDFYLTLTNVTMLTRPDLFDPHSVHFHGFPQASSIFDGMPEGSISIFAGSSLTYYYRIREPGTYMYHCHVEAPEHMQMGMTGSLYVHPIQDRLCRGELAGQPRPSWCGTWKGFAYDDGDGSTGYDVEFPIQMQSYDPLFHQAEIRIQPLPIFELNDKYGVLNGRGYPDTIAPVATAAFPTTPPQAASAEPIPSTAVLDNFEGPIPAIDTRTTVVVGGSTVPNPNYGQPLFADPPPSNDCVNNANPAYCNNAIYVMAGQNLPGPRSTQRESAYVAVKRGQRLLLRISSLDVTRIFTLATQGFTMNVVGLDARLLRNGSRSLAYQTTSLTFGGGQSADALVDTTGMPPGRYFIHTTNLNYLANDQEPFGGMMTEIEVTP